MYYTEPVQTVLYARDILFVVAYIFIIVMIISAVIPAAWRNKGARSYLAGKLKKDVANAEAYSYDIQQVAELVFHYEIRDVQSAIVASDNEWMYARVTIDFVDNSKEPSYWKVETSYQLFVRRLVRTAPEIALDQRGNSSVNPLYAYGWKIAHGELVYCEAEFMDKYRMYCRPGEEVSGLSLLAPDALVMILNHMPGTDMYIVGEYLCCIMPNRYTSAFMMKRIFEKTAVIVRELNTNLSRT